MMEVQHNYNLEIIIYLPFHTREIVIFILYRENIYTSLIVPRILPRKQSSGKLGA